MHLSKPSAPPVRFSGERLRLIQLVQTGLVCVLGGVGIVASGFSFELDNAVLLASSLVSLVVVWSFYSWHLLGRRWFAPYGLFLMSASLFNGGQAFLEVLGLNSHGVLGSRFAPQLTVKALYLVALGLGSLHLGAIWAVGNNRGRRPSETHSPARSRASSVVGWSCLLVAAFPVAVVVKDVVSSAASLGIGGLYDRPTTEFLPSAVRVLASYLIPGIMFLTAGNQKRRGVLIALCILVIAYSGIMILAGVRREGAPLLIAFAWLYDTRVRRLPRTALLPAGIACIGLFAIVAIIRVSQVSWLDSIEQYRATSTLADNPIIAGVTEMGATLVTVAHTINLIPSVRPFDYGADYGYALLTLMPNVGWDIHPAVAHGSYSDWLIRTVEPVSAAHGGGLGFSFIAEAFANFGWYGVVPLMALLGYFLVKMSDWATLTDDPARYAAVAAFMVFFLFFARADTTTIFRPLVYCSVLPYAIVGLLTRKRAAQPNRVRQLVIGARC